MAETVDMATVQAAKAENWPQQDMAVNVAVEGGGDPVVIRSIKGESAVKLAAW